MLHGNLALLIGETEAYIYVKFINNGLLYRVQCFIVYIFFLFSYSAFL